jgi:hypothetical protein
MSALLLTALRSVFVTAGTVIYWCAFREVQHDDSDGIGSLKKKRITAPYALGSGFNHSSKSPKSIAGVEPLPG